MGQTNEANQRKQTLIQLVSRLRVRANLSQDEIQARMGKVLDIEYSDGRYAKFRTRPDVSSRHDLDELMALIRTLTEDITPDQRCTAREALQLFDLSGIELKDFQRLREIFAASEFDKAWGLYQSERNLGPNGESSTGDYFVPLYPRLFIGRDHDVNEIYARLGVVPETRRQPLTIIRCWPGVGKTTLVNRLVYDPKL